MPGLVDSYQGFFGWGGCRKRAQVIPGSPGSSPPTRRIKLHPGTLLNPAVGGARISPSQSLQKHPLAGP